MLNDHGLGNFQNKYVLKTKYVLRKVSIGSKLFYWKQDCRR